MKKLFNYLKALLLQHEEIPLVIAFHYFPDKKILKFLERVGEPIDCAGTIHLFMETKRLKTSHRNTFLSKSLKLTQRNIMKVLIGF